MKILSIVNQKCSVGKTITAVNLAIGLANNGKKVLAIDLDPQGSMSLSLGVADTDKIMFTINDILRNVANGIEFDDTQAIMTNKENIDFIPSNLTLTMLEADLMQAYTREYVLRNYLASLDNRYDYVIIDCSPSLGILTINALACSHELIIPVQAQYLPVRGMEQLFLTISKIKQQVNIFKNPVPMSVKVSETSYIVN